MKIEKKRKQWFSVELIAIYILIAVGMFMIAQVFTQYGQLVVNNQDAQLYFLAQVVDRNIENVLERCETNLNYVTGRRGFLEAEQHWRNTGDTEDLRFRLEENILAQDELISSVLAIKDGEIFLSSNNKLEYSFLENTGSGNLKYCVDENESIYLAFISDGEEDLQYAAIMNLDVFYQQIVGVELATYDWVILTDSSSQILLYHQQGQLQVEQVDAVSGATCGQEGVNILLDQQKKQVIGTSSYEYVEHLTDESYTARMVTIPTDETENKAFAIGIVTNFEDVMKPLRGAAIRLMCYGGMVAAGVILLLVIIISSKRRDEEHQQELEVLREKNEVMEELNRKTQELAHHQRLETIGTLTSGIAHEFNNLLTPIMGYSMLTLEQLPMDNEELYDNVLEIYHASRKAKDITSRLSELSRKNTPTSFKKVSLKELVEKVKHVAMPVLPAGVQVEMQMPEEECFVMGNETQLSQMLLNLVLNAFQAMEKTGGVLTIHIFQQETYAVISVKDTGAGIPDHIIEQIYEPFFTTKETGKGTGLGLAIVRQVVNEHKGTIRVNSKEGEGTVFTVEVPLEK